MDFEKYKGLYDKLLSIIPTIPTMPTEYYLLINGIDVEVKNVIYHIGRTSCVEKYYIDYLSNIIEELDTNLEITMCTTISNFYNNYINLVKTNAISHCSDYNLLNICISLLNSMFVKYNLDFIKSIDDTDENLYTSLVEKLGEEIMYKYCEVCEKRRNNNKTYEPNTQHIYTLYGKFTPMLEYSKDEMKFIFDNNDLDNLITKILMIVNEVDGYRTTFVSLLYDYLMLHKSKNSRK